MRKKQEFDYDDYRHLVINAIAAIKVHHFYDAEKYLRWALALDYSRPDAFNIIGLLMEIKGNGSIAQNYYRAALSLDPTYVPAQDNLDRSVGFGIIGKKNFGYL